jgi:hypothetical protein
VQVVQNLLLRSNFVLRFTLPDFYSLTPLGDWAPFLRHPVLNVKFPFSTNFLPKLVDGEEVDAKKKNYPVAELSEFFLLFLGFFLRQGPAISCNLHVYKMFCECSCSASARRLGYAIPLTLAKYHFLD